MIKTNDIHIRDPFVVPVMEDKTYYLFGTTDENCLKGPGVGFNCFKSKNLSDWEGPFQTFFPPESFWGKENFWAPEIYCFNSRYYMFASFKAETIRRATHILVSDSIIGPYLPLTESPQTPPEWECLDGTLFIDCDGDPWIVFCREFIQIKDGSICATRLSSDLKQTQGETFMLFMATDAPWVCDWPEKKGFYVTDGPFLHHLSDGTLIMLWSSFGKNGYSLGVARSETGKITGPWIQEQEPLWREDGGHGMIFKTFDNHLIMTLHTPNTWGKERPAFLKIKETKKQGLIILKNIAS